MSGDVVTVLRVLHVRHVLQDVVTFESEVNDGEDGKKSC